MENKLTFEKLFNRDINDPQNKHFLEQVTREHPFFSPAHFFLLQQTDPQSPEYYKQAGITSILFNNPYWLNFQLQQSNKPIEQIEMPAIQDENIAGITENSDNNDDEAIVHQETETMIKEGINGKDKSLGEVQLFEPLHMVDYFASQGIKLSEDTQTADKLGKQLKSFTEWLKTMKKVHSETTTGTAIPSENTDKLIQIIAEKSNTENEILTESMAEVFAKQGKIARAIEVYQKLSLLNPYKIAYFAAKIEYLKGI